MTQILALYKFVKKLSIIPCLMPQLVLEDPGPYTTSAGYNEEDGLKMGSKVLFWTVNLTYWGIADFIIDMLTYVITGSTYSLNTFVLICMLALQLLMMLSTLLKAAHPKLPSINPGPIYTFVVWYVAWLALAWKS